MTKKSLIEWTEATWNPWHGCRKVSAGCKNCYMYRDKRRKRGVDHPEDIVDGDRPVESIAQLVELEQHALSQLRAYDQGEASLEATLQAVLAYDRLFGEDRDHESWYRRVLEDRPWKTCDCPICREIGIEVVVFRGNNRNRRRGYHNVRVLYERFRQLVEDV